MNALLEAALQYAGRGWFVHPCEPRGKKPLTKNGFKDASTDPKQIEAWWAKNPNANIGLATGKTGFAVLDCDGPEGLAQLQALAAPHGGLPRTLTVRTARGVHLYYAGTIKSTQVKGEKLDSRGSTGYVIAPPSVHESGAVYAWLDPLAPIAPVPEWVVQWAANRRSVNKTPPASFVSAGGFATPETGLLPPGLGGSRNLAQRSIAAQAETPYSETEANRLRSALSVIDAAIDGATWFSFGAALHDLKWIVNGSDQGFEIWDEWSATSQGEGPGNGEYKGRADLEKRWAGFDREYNGVRTTVSSIYHFAREAGWQGENINGHNSLQQITAPFFQQATFANPIIWPDRDQWGRPKATCRNARAAIRHMQIICEHDRFHDKLIIGGEAIEQWSGELTDHATHMLRVMIAQRYNVDPGTTNTFDAAVQECLQDSFDPVFEYLDALQWDGMPRLRTWLRDYMGAADSPLNSAIGGLALIAAVRRARQPGCKFDEITVLISEEGRNKSTAIEILAGADNFSDQTILTLDDRAQQEALQGVWLYEIADLAGMSKADTEKVKAFASRKVDRARPAYARARMDKPRRCIFIATTNHSTFLKSQTGNRRFWPVEVGRIDLGALARDRDQLWAEAAACEARGVSLRLPEALWPAASEAQRARMDHDPWEDELFAVTGNIKNKNGVFYKSPDGRFFEARIFTKNIFRNVLHLPVEKWTDVTPKRVTFIMRRLGWDGPKLIRDGEEVSRGFTKQLGPVTGVTSVTE